MKARYNYGLVIFNLIFCLVSISGYRETELVKIAVQRVSTIILGSLMAMVVCPTSACSWVDLDLVEISSVIAVTSFLMDIVICIGKISEAVDELASLANFKVLSETAAVKAPSQRHQPVLHQGMVQPFSVITL
ncbi:hypothetical protein CRG98_006304 [Punica granatum]|uniref:Uncharacterized protein n=1 Tax=Punica granatum TaxID=22663 RepID=A0A2I0KZQ7_PUNGR|nr:hypothetical protein CRG98_006304 [Punica granatum]